MTAVMFGETSEVIPALRAGADPAAADVHGTTPLYAAAVQGRADTAALLLEAGAPPDAESAGLGAEGTPLCAAACWGYLDAVRVLLAHGADPGLREDHGTGLTPLEWATAGSHEETAAVLRAAGAR